LIVCPALAFVTLFSLGRDNVEAGGESVVQRVDATVRSALNPYEGPAATRQHASDDAIKWIYLACASLALSATMFGVVEAYFMCVAAMGIGLWWLHATWSAFEVAESEGISPAGAWARCLIPVYGYYWSVSAHIILCRNVNDALTRNQVSARVSPMLAVLGALAMAACGKWPALAPVSGVLWFAYMCRIDGARRRVSSAA
jgi:hypothetical protein